MFILFMGIFIPLNLIYLIVIYRIYCKPEKDFSQYFQLNREKDKYSYIYTKLSLFIYYCSRRRLLHIFVNIIVIVIFIYYINIINK